MSETDTYDQTSALNDGLTIAEVSDGESVRDHEPDIISLYYKEVHHAKHLSPEDEMLLAKELFDANQKRGILTERLLICITDSMAGQESGRKVRKHAGKGIPKEFSEDEQYCIEAGRNLQHVTARIKKLERLRQKTTAGAHERRKLSREKALAKNEYIEIMNSINQRCALNRNIFSLLVARLKKKKRVGAARLKEMHLLLQDLLKTEACVKQTKDILVQKNLGLVLKVARKYFRTDISLSDLIQEGNIGLMQAVDKFDYRRGCRLSTYACWWIQQRIARFIDDNVSTIRIPVHIREKMRKIAKGNKKILQTEGKEPTSREISKKMHMPQKTIEKLLEAGKPCLSLESPVGNGETTLQNFISDSSAMQPLDEVLKLQLHETTSEALLRMKPREGKVLKLRFGIDADAEYTLEEIGKEFGITRERVRQIEKAALAKMRRSQKYQLLKSFSQN